MLRIEVDRGKRKERKRSQGEGKGKKDERPYGHKGVEREGGAKAGCETEFTHEPNRTQKEITCSVRSPILSCDRLVIGIWEDEERSRKRKGSA